MVSRVILVYRREVFNCLKAFTADKFFWKKFEQPQAGPKGGGQEARNSRKERRGKPKKI